MKIGDILYFAPNLAFKDLDFNDPGIIAHAFQEPVRGFYLEPAERSVKAGDAFAAGLTTLAAIEFIALSYKQEPQNWISEHLGLPIDVAKKLWGRFRDALSHEGRVRSGQFSADLNSMIEEEGGVLVVNPGHLLDGVRQAFQRFCTTLDDKGKI